MERLREIRRVLSKTMPTVSYPALIAASHVESSQGFVKLMHDVENALQVHQEISCTRDTVIFAVFHWVCFRVKVMHSLSQVS